uniref:Uncharacterized protein n=1 Tax=Parascaris univalens TaxID=6257 RepID=A0A915CCQ9_PARUN
IDVMGGSKDKINVHLSFYQVMISGNVNIPFVVVLSNYSEAFLLLTMKLHSTHSQCAHKLYSALLFPIAVLNCYRLGEIIESSAKFRTRVVFLCLFSRMANVFFDFARINRYFQFWKIRKCFYY